jgi:hypothetical protein
MQKEPDERQRLRTILLIQRRVDSAADLQLFDTCFMVLVL